MAIMLNSSPEGGNDYEYHVIAFRDSFFSLFRAADEGEATQESSYRSTRTHQDQNGNNQASDFGGPNCHL